MHTCMKMWFRGVTPSNRYSPASICRLTRREAYNSMSGWHAIIGEGHSRVLRSHDARSRREGGTGRAPVHHGRWPGAELGHAHPPRQPRETVVLHRRRTVPFRRTAVRQLRYAAWPAASHRQRHRRSRRWHVLVGDTSGALPFPASHRAGGAVIRSRSATWRTGSPEGVGLAQDRRWRGLEWHRGRAFPGRNRRAAAWAPSPACDSFTARWRLSQHLVAGRKP